MHMAAGIDIQWERKNGVLIAALVGRVDGGNAAEFQHLLEASITPEDQALILDLEQLSFISSAGLRVGLIIARRLNELGQQFGICTLPAHVRGVITISGLAQLISVYESRTAALKAITGESGSDSDDQDQARGEKIPNIKNEVDFDIVGDNVQEIVDFTVEKYEFRNNTTLSAEIREKGVAKIKDALWQRIEVLKQRRQQVLQEIFNSAEKMLAEVIDKQS